MAKVNKILTAFLLALAACSTKYDEVAPDTILKVSVINESTSLPLKDATVYIYDDSTLFKQTITSVDEPTGFITSSVTNDTGNVVIPKLKPGVQYFVYAYYQDFTIVDGTYITLDNSAQQFVLKNELVRGSITKTTIPVRASDGFVVFWTKASNAVSLPINTFIANSSVGAITQGNAAPIPFQPGNVTARARAGITSVEGKSITGCLWVNQVNVVAGGILNYGLSDCDVGTVAFYTDNLNAGVLPIQLTLNANDPIGNISAVVASTPVDCSAANLATAVRIPGNYTYQATSNSGNCVWSGTFTLTSGACTLIYLTQCN